MNVCKYELSCVILTPILQIFYSHQDRKLTSKKKVNSLRCLDITLHRLSDLVSLANTIVTFCGQELYAIFQPTWPSSHFYGDSPAQNCNIAPWGADRNSVFHKLAKLSNCVNFDIIFFTLNTFKSKSRHNIQDEAVHRETNAIFI